MQQALCEDCRPSRSARSAKNVDEDEAEARECLDDKEEPQVDGGHAAATVAVLESDILQLQVQALSLFLFCSHSNLDCKLSVGHR